MVKTKSSQKQSDREIDAELAAEEEELLFESDESELPPSDIVAFNELRSCADLFRMHESGQLTIQPDFQRDIVWTNPAQTRFIDSLVKELPIPSMCISFDHGTGERLVIDGLQRMATILKFLGKESWKLSPVKDVDSRIAGRTNSYIRAQYRQIFGRIENLTIPITVLRCDYAKHSHMKYLFTIFHRLNTGGSKLSNQEIRNCIFSGPLNELLKECALNEPFRHLLGLASDRTYRFAYEELVLRFTAFSDKYSDYDGKLSSYLNDYMEKNRKPSSAFLKERKTRFDSMVNLLYEKVYDGGAMPRHSKAIIESILVGIGRNLPELTRAQGRTIRTRITDLLAQPEFAPANLKNALTARDKLIARFQKAERVIGGK
jgi:hypothetical protein